jgi:putative ABC transport system substrate-binding protein
MRRREFIALVGGTAALWPLSVSAQQADKVHRIGFLGLGTASTWAPRVNALRTGLREHGYSEGRNFVFDFQWADTFDRLRDGATELARRNVEVIFAMTSTEVEAARAKRRKQYQLCSPLMPIQSASAMSQASRGRAEI